MPWPVDTYALVSAPSRPMIGRPSGVIGRMPARGVTGPVPAESSRGSSGAGAAQDGADPDLVELLVEAAELHRSGQPQVAGQRRDGDLGVGQVGRAPQRVRRRRRCCSPCRGAPAAALRSARDSGPVQAPAASTYASAASRSLPGGDLGDPVARRSGRRPAGRSPRSGRRARPAGGAASASTRWGRRAAPWGRRCRRRPGRTACGSCSRTSSPISTCGSRSKRSGEVEELAVVVQVLLVGEGHQQPVVRSSKSIPSAR